MKLSAAVLLTLVGVAHGQPVEDSGSWSAGLVDDSGSGSWSAGLMDDSGSGSWSATAVTLCAADQYVSSNACVACPPGTTNAADDDASGDDTTCDATLCAADLAVTGNACVACPPGTTNAADDDASGDDTTCDATLCARDQYVSSNACLACADGTNNGAGDDASGDDTACVAPPTVAVQCDVDYSVSGYACTPCAPGTNNAAGDAEFGENTSCDAVVCELNEYVIANSCAACGAGTENAAGNDASGANTACTAIPTTGMCTGNTGGTGDVTCPAATHIPKPDPETIKGTDAATCCDELPAEEAALSYTWEATAYSPQYCTKDCGANAARTRTVVCTEISVWSTGEFNRAPADDEASCTETKPVETSACDTVPEGATCVDGNDETMDDVCIASDVCAGKVQLASAATFPLAIETLILPDTSSMSEEDAVAALATNPVAVAVKGGLATSLAVAADTITIKSIAAGSVVVDYVVALPATEVAAAKTASETAVPDVTIPEQIAADGTVIVAQTATGTVTPLKSYAYASASSCGAPECSVACDAAAVTAADVYSCLEDGAVVALPLCHPTLGEPVATNTECCPAADAETCEESAAAITAPPPSPSPSPSSPPSDGGDDGAIVAIIAAVLVLGLILACYFYKAGGDDEKPATAGGPDVEAGGAGEDEKRAVLEKRLAHVRNQLPEEGA